MSTRESYVFDKNCSLCAQESLALVPRINTRVCPNCFDWVSESVGLDNLGIVVEES
jgi:hypothetical protein